MYVQYMGTRRKKRQKRRTRKRIKRQIGKGPKKDGYGYDSEQYDLKKEQALFSQFSIPTKRDIAEELMLGPIEAEDFFEEGTDTPFKIQNKFFISSHGSQLLHSSFAHIIIPDNMTLYFQSRNGYSCSRPDTQDTINYVCYHPDFEELFQDENGNWTNECVTGMSIPDCELSFDEHFLSKVIVCGNEINGAQTILKILLNHDILLSEVLLHIHKYMTRHALGNVRIFCSFCLLPNYHYNQQLINKQYQIQTQMPQLLIGYNY